jgi:HPt (histidine-containing phosphotransfer) domain-containing protein
VLVMIGWLGKSEAAGPPILDEGYLERLASHIGMEEARELLADGMLELSDRLDRLAQLASDRDVEGLLTLTHDIAGAAGHMGLSAMSHEAVEANRTLREGTGGDPSSVVSRLARCRDPSIDALGRFCRGSGSAKPSG